MMLNSDRAASDSDKNSATQPVFNFSQGSEFKPTNIFYPQTTMTYTAQGEFAAQ